MSTAIAVAGVAVISGGVLAATNGHVGGPADGVVDRMAEILEVDSDDLSDALSQARSEASEEKRAERLSQLLEDGTLTQEQVDEINAWLDARPAVLDEIGLHGGHGFKGHGPASDDRLAQLVEDGTLNQEQADEIKAWHDARPDALSELRSGHGGHSGRHGRGGHGFGGQFKGSFDGDIEGRFRSSFGQRFGERFNLEVPGVGQGIELFIPPTNGNSA